MKVGSFDTDRAVLIVAEIGNNHEGSFELAAELVREAARCGVRAVKFQTVRAAHLVRRAETDRFARLTRFELSQRQFAELSELARELGLLFISTPLSLGAAAFLEPMVDAYKVASGDNDFFPLLEKVAGTGKPVVVSTGVSDVSQVDATVRFLRGQWASRGTAGDLALLHCVSSYPTPPHEANLRSIPYLAERFGCTVGYSDHTLGTEIAALAVAAGARIIEKHFTLDKHQSDFRDHQLSADPEEMTELVNRVIQVDLRLGSPDKTVQPCEAASQTAIRRSIVAARELQAGATMLVGRRLKRDLRENEAFSLADVE
jgi:N,N'-diacetyllegionaminate synthase